jgi:hypothetical protein
LVLKQRSHTGFEQERNLLHRPGGGSIAHCRAKTRMKTEADATGKTISAVPVHLLRFSGRQLPLFFRITQ